MSEARSKMGGRGLRCDGTDKNTGRQCGRRFWPRDGWRMDWPEVRRRARDQGWIPGLTHGDWCGWERHCEAPGGTRDVRSPDEPAPAEKS